MRGTRQILVADILGDLDRIRLCTLRNKSRIRDFYLEQVSSSLKTRSADRIHPHVKDCLSPDITSQAVSILRQFLGILSRRVLEIKVLYRNKPIQLTPEVSIIYSLCKVTILTRILDTIYLCYPFSRPFTQVHKIIFFYNSIKVTYPSFQYFALIEDFELCPWQPKKKIATEALPFDFPRNLSFTAILTQDAKPFVGTIRRNT